MDYVLEHEKQHVSANKEWSATICDAEYSENKYRIIIAKLFNPKREFLTMNKVITAAITLIPYLNIDNG